MQRNYMMSMLAALSIPMMAGAQSSAAKCAPDNVGLKLPAGFCASMFADTLRGARHLVFAPNGDVFVSTIGRGKAGVVGLREMNHSGQADTRQQFASGFVSSEVALFDGYLYTEALPPGPPGAAGGGRGGPQPPIAILRYPLKAGELVPSGAPDTIVSGLPGQPGHSTRNFVITREGAMYVNVGSMTNSCQSEDRKKGIPGVNPCTELETRADI